MTDLMPVPDMQMVWIRLLAPKSPSFTFPEESLRMLAPGGSKQNELESIQDSPESCQTQRDADNLELHLLFWVKSDWCQQFKLTEEGERS